MRRSLQAAGVALALGAAQNARAEEQPLFSTENRLKWQQRSNEAAAPFQVPDQSKIGQWWRESAGILEKRVRQVAKGIDFIGDVRARARAEDISVIVAGPEIFVARFGAGLVAGTAAAAAATSMNPALAPVTAPVAFGVASDATEKWVLDRYSAQRGFQSSQQIAERQKNEIERAARDPQLMARVQGRLLVEQQQSFQRLMGSPLPQAPAREAGGTTAAGLTNVPSRPPGSGEVQGERSAPNGAPRSLPYSLSGASTTATNPAVAALNPPAEQGGPRPLQGDVPPKSETRNGAYANKAGDLGPGIRVGAYEDANAGTGKADPKGGTNGTPQARSTSSDQPGGLRGSNVKEISKGEYRIGAYADDPSTQPGAGDGNAPPGQALQRMKQQLKQPDMNMRATAQTGARPQVASREQSGMPATYRQELAQRARQQREDQARIQRERDVARQAALRQRLPPGYCWNNLDRGGAVECIPWKGPVATPNVGNVDQNEISAQIFLGAMNIGLNALTHARRPRVQPNSAYPGQNYESCEQQKARDDDVLRQKYGANWFYYSGASCLQSIRPTN